MSDRQRDQRDQRDDDRRSPRRVPLLPLRDIVVFPHMVVPLFVGREKSISALEEAMGKGGYKEIFLSAQRKAKTNEPVPDDIFTVGTIGTIIQLLRLPDGTVKVLVEGKRRAAIRRFTQTEGFFTVEIEELPDVGEKSVELDALMREVHTTFEAYVKLNKRIAPEILISVQTIEDPGQLADTMVGQLQLKLADKQAILEMDAPSKRLSRLYELMKAEIEILQVERKIRTRVKKQMEKTQKEYYLNEQMQAIQKELGDRDEFKNELTEMEERAKQKNLSREAQAKVKKELKKLRMMAPMSAEAAVVRNYVDWVLALPWGEKTEEKLDVIEAERILDQDHYGLKKVKERILEYLAVQALVKKLKGPILCLVGPPGVGKTSLARSIAHATGRTFVRLSLGGVRDEAEIRGHRRTYIGALPGKIIQSLKKAGSQNPVFLLDEVDKMSTDFRGDPSAALLEVLDPEQNNTFNDHYLDLDYDLSDVMFITTANYLHGIPIPLQDRMEIIQLPGYTEFEKVSIAEKYLVPKQKQDNGIADVKLDIGEDVVRDVIHFYTKEAGVRNLEREIATVCRKVARDVVAKKLPLGIEGKPEVKITPKRLPRYLGPHRFRYGRQEGAQRDRPGQRPGGHDVRRRSAGDRGVDRRRQGQAGADRQARRRDAGVGAGGDQLRALARAVAGAGPRRLLQPRRHPRAPARGRDPQGWPVGGHHHVHRAGLGAAARPGAARRRHDRRDHAARARAGDRRAEGEDPRRASLGHHHGDHAQGERQGPARHSQARAEDAAGRPRRAHGRGAARGAGAARRRELPQGRVGRRRLAPAGRSPRPRQGSPRGIVALPGRQRRAAAERHRRCAGGGDREPPSDSPLEDRLPRPTPSTDIGYPTPEPAIREE